MITHNNHVKKYLFIPSIPTPNGSLHLGHIGGPYLRADIISRFLKICGHKSYIACGIDSYDSYVLLQSYRENKNPREVNNKYYQSILKDLENLDISINLMINPLEKPWNIYYQKWCKYVFKELEKKNALLLEKEKFLWDPENHHFTIGCWLTGNCPRCHEKTESYFCEKCITHFKPEEIINPSSRINKKTSLIQEELSNWFIKIQEPINIDSLGIEKKIKEEFLLFLKNNKNLMRLTTPTYWGLQLVDKYNKNYMFFNYGFAFAYFLMLGELIGEIDGSVNTFLKDSSFININSFGIDNTIPFLSSTYGITSHLKHFKPFDHYLINHFYNLNNTKFSTSRNNAIWAASAIQESKLSSDIIRLYLASIPVASSAGNFITQEFLEFYNKIGNYINNYIYKSLTQLLKKEKPLISSNITNYFINYFEKQKFYLDLKSFLPDSATEIVIEWLSCQMQLTTFEDYYWWLKGFCLLSHSFMPKLSNNIWQILMEDSEINIKNFLIIKAINNSNLILKLSQKVIYSITLNDLQKLYDNTNFSTLKD